MNPTLFECHVPGKSVMKIMILPSVVLRVLFGWKPTCLSRRSKSHPNPEYHVDPTWTGDDRSRWDTAISCTRQHERMMAHHLYEQVCSSTRVVRGLGSWAWQGRSGSRRSQVKSRWSTPGASCVPNADLQHAWIREVPGLTRCARARSATEYDYQRRAGCNSELVRWHPIHYLDLASRADGVGLAILLYPMSSSEAPAAGHFQASQVRPLLC